MSNTDMIEAKKIRIEMVKSSIGSTEKQRNNLRALGLRKIGSKSIKLNNPSVRGSIRVVAHLVNCEPVE